ncbi:calcium homeostasis modulator protein 5-like isoform X1 [Protopterus annectens]|uniref:calcium homeostasis modulator protein 5-like isoform X1 n=1 Tax=Protopterus annectens TaxID=7888 RepID=UPI001CFBE09F|nr:calcium homeostasis modulator protein 5-like isoform X1 [Protopterus annectens]
MTFNLKSMDALQAIVKFLTEQKTTIGYSVLAVLTYGGQRLFSVFAFKCPCSSQNLNYGLVFLFVPALVLLIISVYFDCRTWILSMGCCLNPSKRCPYGSYLNCLCILVKATGSAFIAPLIWLCAALLNGTFYECALSGLENDAYRTHLCQNKPPSCKEDIYRVPCEITSMNASDSEDIHLILRAQSQVIGWSLIASTAIALLLVSCYSACRSQVSYLQEMFWRKYIEKERQHFEQFSDDYATKLADRNLKSFFENTKPDPLPLPSNNAWEEISALYSFNRAHQYYSTLHRYVEGGKRESNEDIQPAFGFVDGGQII